MKDRINTPAVVGPQNWSWRLPASGRGPAAARPPVVARFEAIRGLATRDGAVMDVEVGAPSPAGQHVGTGAGSTSRSSAGTPPAVDLCLFDEAGRRDADPRADADAACLAPLRAWPPSRSALRLAGRRPVRARAGHRFNRNKLLVDPVRARARRRARSAGPVYGYPSRPRRRRPAPSIRATTPSRSRRASSSTSLRLGRRCLPRVPWRETVIYELHVRGFTRLHPAVPEPMRGKFLGLASDAAIEHLTSLGVTTVKLMPVHARADEPALVARGLTTTGATTPSRSSRPTVGSRPTRGRSDVRVSRR